MSLTVFPHVEQRSDEWFEQRRGMVTASVVGQLLTPSLKVADNDTSRALTRLLVAERITGHTEGNTYTTQDMLRGIYEEPRAIAHYQQHTGLEVEKCGFMRWDDEAGWQLGYSPDGLVRDQGAVEVKSPRPQNHLQTILTGKIPHHHMAQMQAGMYVAGRWWCDYVSFCGGMPLYVERVLLKSEWENAIQAAMTAFEENARAIVATYRDRTHGLPIPERIDYFDELEIH